jgi:16S rRNA (guanine966-N2)-methyltransferase
MRIIAGRARGLKLEPPGELPVRPSLDRVREAVFSALMGRIEGAHFLDLFAGTGANGIEALSRGAASATLVDSNPRVCALIRRNLAKTRLHADARVLLLDLPGELARAAAPEGPYGLVYADPPHTFSDYTALLAGLETHGLVAAGGWVVLEHPARAGIPQAVGRWGCARTRRYGKSGVSIFT